ncbi:hypothetical protein D9V34_08250 [Mycetocola lacteus]|uniref:Uncharacterized protein n=1 Tax=Mycetocola lacteus TaxID=76637 RepID=A0A3L7AUK0_9MICO|nr:hypothetical protein [Mycetocola lacteus]RLP83211.1 hypothetical protein D9V34_08250 [Mycetocola lacteus]
MSTNTPDKNGHNSEPEQELRIEDLVAEAQQENAEDAPTAAHPVTPSTADETASDVPAQDDSATAAYPQSTPATAQDSIPTAAYPQSTPTTTQDSIPTAAYPEPHTATPNYPYVPPAAYPTGAPVAVGTRVEAPINRTPRAFTIVWGMLLLAFGVLLVARNVWDISVDPITLAFAVVTAAGVVLVGCGIGMVVRNARKSTGAK